MKKEELKKIVVENRRAIKDIIRELEKEEILEWVEENIPEDDYEDEEEAEGVCPHCREELNGHECYCPSCGRSL